MTRSDLITHSLLAVILLAGFVMRLQNLGHTGLQGLDESFHAVVAANLLHDPFVPRLYTEPALPVPAEMELAWHHQTVWLHKPPLAMYQMAAAMWLGGQNTLAMRMPSAVLSTGVAWLAFLIARTAFGRLAGLWAALTLTFMPTVWGLAHGRVFSDHVDIAMLFYLTLAMWLLTCAVRRGSLSFSALAGLAMGLAYLSKSFPALIVLGVAVVMVIAMKWPGVNGSLKQIGHEQDAHATLGWHHVGVLSAAGLLTVLPWTLYVWIRFPEAFMQSTGLILSHLGSDVEGWAAPADRVLFHYAASIAYRFYTPGLIAISLAVVIAWRTRSVWLLMIVAWWAGFMLPHVLAASKTPSQTTPAIVPLMIALGWLLGEAWRGRRWAVAATLAVGVNVLLDVTGLLPMTFLNQGRGGELGEIARAQWWIVANVLLSLGAAGLGAWLERSPQNVEDDQRADVRPQPASPGVQAAPPKTLGRARALAVAGMLVLCWPVWQSVIACRAIAALPFEATDYLTLLPHVEQLPPDTIFLVDEQTKLEHMTAMFYLRRNAYAVDLNSPSARSIERAIRDLPATPVLIARQDLALPQLPGLPGPLHVYQIPAD